MYLYYGKIKDGKLEFDKEEGYKYFLQNNEGENVVIKIKKAYSSRSEKQNKLYWFYLNLIETETGNIASELHEFFKRKFLKPRFIKVLGNEIRIPGSTTDLDKLEFTEYLRNIEILTGIPIPDLI